MATAGEIKEDLRFNGELMDLLEAMKNIAVFQFRALQRTRERFEPLRGLMEGFFRVIDIEKSASPMAVEKSDRTAMVIITSDEGFMGGLNLRVINAALAHPGAKNAEILMIGERGAYYLKESGLPFTPFRAADHSKRRELAAKVADYAIDGIAKKRFGRVCVSYPYPVSFMVQRVEIAEILPLSGVRGQGSGDGGRNSDNSHDASRTTHDEDTIIESPPDGIIEYLARATVFQRLAGALEESKLSEFAARAIHLEKSNRDLTDRQRLLKLRYFHAHHEIIDKGIREIFSAQIIRKRDK